MKWKYIKPLKSSEAIREFEGQFTGNFRFEFPLSFKRWVLSHNGGRPEKYCFETMCGTKEKTMKCLLSFNRDDKENIWNHYGWMKDRFNGRFVPFAIDNFGNYLCFDQIGTVLFVSLDPLGYEVVSYSFEQFLKILY